MVMLNVTVHSLLWVPSFQLSRSSWLCARQVASPLNYLYASTSPYSVVELYLRESTGILGSLMDLAEPGLCGPDSPTWRSSMEEF